jgi:hypothetical protein
VDNVTVCADDVLIIEPGDGLWASKSVGFRVEGGLEANGTTSQDIFLTWDVSNERWAGFDFVPGSYGYFANCSVFGAEVEIQSDDAEIHIDECELGFGGGALWLYNGSVGTLTNSAVLQHEYNTILVNGSSLTLTDVLELLSSDGVALLATNGSLLYVEGLETKLNYGGIIITESTAELQNLNVSESYFPGSGLSVYKSVVTVRDSVISGNEYVSPGLSLWNIRVEESEAAFTNVSVRDANVGISLESSTVTLENSSFLNSTGIYPSKGVWCLGGSEASELIVLNSHFIGSPIVTDGGCGVSLLDSELEDGGVEVQAGADLTRNNFRNATVKFGPLLRARDNSFLNCDVAFESYVTIPEGAARLDNNSVVGCGTGVKMGQYARTTVVVGNGTFSDITEFAVDALSGGKVFLVNTPVPDAQITGSSKSVYRANFLTVRALGKDDVPVEGAEVRVTFLDLPLWANETGADGTLAWIPAPFQVFAGESATPRFQDGDAVVTVTAPGIYFSDSPRQVDMTQPRTEVFYADTAPPKISHTDPPSGAKDVSVTTRIVIEFDKAMDTASVEGALSMEGIQIDRIQWDADLRTITVFPSGPLDRGATYTVRVTTAARDIAGNAMAKDYVWTFTTENGAVGPPVLEEIWPWLLMAAIAATGVLLVAVVYRRRRPKELPPSESARPEGLPPPPEKMPRPKPPPPPGS